MSDAQQPAAELTVVPAHADLTEGEQQRFLAVPPGVSVTWDALAEDNGTLKDGVYTAPRHLRRRRAIVLTARSDKQIATAVVHLSDAAYWSRVTGWYLVGSILLALALLAVGAWQFTGDPPETPIVVAPSLVTLGPGDSQDFDVRSLGPSDEAVQVTWSKLPAGSFDEQARRYSAPAKVDAVTSFTITAARKPDGSIVSQTNVVLVPATATAMAVRPAIARLNPGQVVQFVAVQRGAGARTLAAGKVAATVKASAPGRGGEPSSQTSVEAEQKSPAPENANPQTPSTPGGEKPAPNEEPSAPAPAVTWNISPGDAGRIDNGLYTSPQTIERPTLVTVLATASTDPPTRAASTVLIVPSAAPAAAAVAAVPRFSPGLLLFVLVAGALGGLLHAISSFTNFVGNRQYVSDWTWWYIARPLVGALLGLLVYFAVAASLLPQVVALSGIAAIAAVAALSGLFSDQATLKLNEIVATFLTTQGEARKNPLTQTPGTGADVPRIDSFEPQSLAVGSEPVLTITGANFQTAAAVTIGPRVVTSASITATQIKVQVVKADTGKEGQLQVTVTNPGGVAASRTIAVGSKPASAESPVSPIIASFEPKALTVGFDDVVTVKGENFHQDATVSVGTREAEIVGKPTDSEIKIKVTKADTAQPGEIDVKVKNPEGKPAKEPLEVKAP